ADELANHIVLDRLMIGRDIPIASAVKITLADLERVEPERKGYFLDHTLYADHALRSAEAAEGRIGNGIGLQRLRGKFHSGKIVAIVGMEQSPIRNRTREVGRIA